MPRRQASRWPVLAAGPTRGPDGQEIALEHVVALGALDGAALRRPAAARAAVFASLALYEPFGLAVLEAALAGCALVLSDIADLPGALAATPRCSCRRTIRARRATPINRLIDDRELRLRLARAGASARRRATRRKPACAARSRSTGGSSGRRAASPARTACGPRAEASGDAGRAVLPFAGLLLEPRQRPLPARRRARAAGARPCRARARAGGRLEPAEPGARAGRGGARAQSGAPPAGLRADAIAADELDLDAGARRRRPRAGARVERARADRAARPPPAGAAAAICCCSTTPTTAR